MQVLRGVFRFVLYVRCLLGLDYQQLSASKILPHLVQLQPLGGGLLGTDVMSI